MDEQMKLLFKLCALIKDMYIIDQLYSDSESKAETSTLLEEAARQIVLWEHFDKKTVNPAG